MKERPSPFIKSGSKPLDKFMGGGFSPGYPWLFVTDGEAEGTAVSAICKMSFNFVVMGYPTLIMATRHPWNISMENYRRAIPKTAENLERASEERRLLVANLFTSPKYRPASDFELYFEPTLYPTQVYREVTRRLEAMKTDGKPIFWRLTSVSDLARYWSEERVTHALGLLLTWLHEKGAIGVATINRELAPEMLVKRAVSLFPNVAYVNTELEGKIKYSIQIAKSMNPKASPLKMEFKLTPKYEVSIG